MEIFVIVIVVLTVFLIILSVKTVGQGMEYIVERFGKYTKTLKPGLNIIIPFIESISYKVNMREQVLDIAKQGVISRDNAVVEADGIVFYQILDSAKSSYEVNNLNHAMRNLCMTNIRTVIGEMNLDEMLSNREQINTRLLSVIDEATNPWGIKVTRIEIKDLEPPSDLVDAMSKQMKAERQKRAEILEAEGKRQAQILYAEGEKKSAVLEAEGRKEAAYRDAEARERLAEAEANATKMVSEAIKQGDPQALNYFVATKYTEAIQNIASADNEKIIFMPLEATSLIGSLGGIGELAKSVFKDKQKID